MQVVEVNLIREHTEAYTRIKRILIQLVGIFMKVIDNSFYKLQ